MHIFFRFGDLLKEAAMQDYIVHQTNSTTTSAAGLAHAIFTAFPHANNYSPKNTNIVGRVEIRGKVVNLCGQFYPGGPSKGDEAERRKEWFEAALRDLSTQILPKSRIAFPTCIGCGLAGGNWHEYLAIIEQWAEKSPFLVTMVESRTPKKIISSGAPGAESVALRLALSAGFNVGGTCSEHDNVHPDFKLQHATVGRLVDTAMIVAQENIDEGNATLVLWKAGDVAAQKCIVYATTGTWPFPNMLPKVVFSNAEKTSKYKPTFVVCSTSFYNMDDIIDFLKKHAVNVLNICASRSATEITFLNNLLNEWVRSIALDQSLKK